MAEARCQFEWRQTSSVMALIANCHRDARKKSTPYRPEDFNPQQVSRNVIPATIDVLRSLVPGG